MMRCVCWVLLLVLVGVLHGCGAMDDDCDELVPQKIRAYDATDATCASSPT